MGGIIEQLQLSLWKLTLLPKIVDNYCLEKSVFVNILITPPRNLESTPLYCYRSTDALSTLLSAAGTCLLMLGIRGRKGTRSWRGEETPAKLG